jgi:hypothetical protein
MPRQWLGAAHMRKALLLGFLAVFVQLTNTSIANAKGPFGNIHVG